MIEEDHNNCHTPSPSTTLNDPQRLQTALHLFTESTTAAPSYDPPSPCVVTVANNGENRMRTETLCRALLEKMLNVKLPKVRPKWLMNPTTKRCLELDMYAEDIKLAFEVDGAQHDVYTPHFHGVHSW